MRVGKGVALAAAAALGVGVGLLPAVATSETPPIEAETYAGAYFRWNPSESTLGEGATVTISNKTEIAHGVEWKEGPETPTCEQVPVGSGHSGTKWSGTCTFKTPGKYVFWCTVHGKSMSATVTVQPASTTTGTTTGTTPGGTTGTTPGGGGGGGTNASPAVSPLA